MKKMKKIAALILAMVMMLALAVPAFAANATISVEENDNRVYEVYQIFTGDLSGSKLSNVKWGANGTGTEGEAVADSVLEAMNAITGTEAQKGAALAEYVDFENTTAIGTVTKTSPLTVATGYYLLKDVTPNLPEGATYSTYVVEIVGPTTIKPKATTTTTEKKVKDVNDTTGVKTDWQDSADHEIGDVIDFQLKATIASDYDAYTSYYYAFHDEQSAGLTFNKNSVKVFVDGVELTSGFEVKTTGFAEGHNCTFEVVFANLKTIPSVHAGSVITVEYTSTLNSSALLGAQGNPNKMYGEFSNNPYDGGTGKTTEDTVIVFTYKVDVDKVTKNEAGEFVPLTGAGFTLYKYVMNTETNVADWVAVGEEVKGEAMTNFAWTGIDDGEYKLVETTTPAGYNTIEPIEFTVVADHVISSQTPTLESLTGNKVTGEVETIVMEANVQNGTLSKDIENKSGIVLPETGGIGTTVFYAIGGILVLAAVVLLVTKKRMRA